MAAIAAFKGGSVALDPLQRCLVGTEQAAGFSQHGLPVLFYLVTLLFHAIAKRIWSRYGVRPTLDKLPGHNAPRLLLSWHSNSSTGRESQVLRQCLVQQCTEFQLFKSVLRTITVQSYPAVSGYSSFIEMRWIIGSAPRVNTASAYFGGPNFATALLDRAIGSFGIPMKLVSSSPSSSLS